MVAKNKVNVKWQIVFALISPLNIWAFYRIKKLTKSALYIFVPSFAIQTPISFQSMNMALDPKLLSPSDINGNIMLLDPTLYAISIISSIGFTILAIILIVKWSKEWNKSFVN